jgi:hypothetical protein
MLPHVFDSVSSPQFRRRVEAELSAPLWQNFQYSGDAAELPRRSWARAESFVVFAAEPALPEFILTAMEYENHYGTGVGCKRYRGDLWRVRFYSWAGLTVDRTLLLCGVLIEEVGMTK